MREKILLIGGGGHCKVVIDAISISGEYEIEGILDANLSLGEKVMDVPVLGDDKLLGKLYKDGIRKAFITVGSIGDHTLREKLYVSAKKAGFGFPMVIHPSAVVAKDVLSHIGEGTFIAASVTINTGTSIGRNVIINTASSIDHDCKIGDFVHIAPRVTFSGGVEVGGGTHIGVGAVVTQYRKIGRNCFVKAKERVSRNMPDGETYPRKETVLDGPYGEEVFIIAEAGVNHNGSLETAKKMIECAKKAGADAVKFQTFLAGNVASRTAPKADYQKKPGADRESQMDMLKKYELNENAHRELIEHCVKNGILFLSTAFDVESVEMLNRLGLGIFKIPSGEITDLPLLRKVGSMGKKVILSTGMATLDEVGSALEVLMRSGTRKDDIVILHCNTAYPTPVEDVNIKAMIMMKKSFGLTVGYSDHTSGIEVSIAAVALGAKVIEKHFTLDRGMEGPDHTSSLEPGELKEMIMAIRKVEKAMKGGGEKTPSPSEIKNREIVRKNLVAARPIRAGEMFATDNIAVKRSGGGVSPMEIDSVIGSIAKRDFETDEGIET